MVSPSTIPMTGPEDSPKAKSAANTKPRVKVAVKNRRDEGAWFRKVQPWQERKSWEELCITLFYNSELLDLKNMYRPLSFR